MGYHLDEKAGWGLNVDSLRAAVEGARKEGKMVRGLVFINPGNPTGGLWFQLCCCFGGGGGGGGDAKGDSSPSILQARGFVRLRLVWV